VLNIQRLFVYCIFTQSFY